MAKKDIRFGLVIDWETSGSGWGTIKETVAKYQGISVGLVIFELRTLLPVDKLYIEIKFDDSKYEWSDEAEKVHGLTREHLAACGKTVEEAVIAVVEFLLKYFGQNPEIYVMAHNAHFDIEFTKQLLEPFEMMFRIQDRVLDTASIAMICFDNYTSNNLFEQTGLTERTQHNALEDAEMTLEAMRRVRLLVQAALNGE